MIGRVAGALALLCAFAPAAAQAGTLTIERWNVLRFEAAPGERNDVHVYRAPSGAIAIEDEGAEMSLLPVLLPDALQKIACLKVKAGFHCRSLEEVEPLVHVHLGDRGDRLASGIALGAELGAGDDVHVGRGVRGGILDAGDGDDRLDLAIEGPYGPEVDLGAGDDAVTARVGAGFQSFAGGPGDDAFEMRGEPGPESHASLAGNDGADRATAAGGPSVSFIPGPGPDTSSPGVAWDFLMDDLDRGPVTVTADGVADDGPAGEGDDVPDGASAILGTHGADVIRLGSRPARVHGWGGADELFGSPAGGDHLIGGGGDDRIHDADGNVDIVDCDQGFDLVEIDPVDLATACEGALGG